MRYMAGAKVKRAGIYNVLHLGHRAPHKAILQGASHFSSVAVAELLSFLNLWNL